MKRLRHKVMLHLRHLTGNAIELDSVTLSALLQASDSELDSDVHAPDIAASNRLQRLRPGWYLLCVIPSEQAMGSHLSLHQRATSQALALMDPISNKRFVQISEPKTLKLQVNSSARHIIGTSLTLERVPTRFALKRQWLKIKNNAQCPAPLFQYRKSQLGDLALTTSKPSPNDYEAIVSCYQALIERRIQPYCYNTWLESRPQILKQPHTDRARVPFEHSAFERLPVSDSLDELPQAITKPALLIDPSVRNHSSSTGVSPIQWRIDSSDVVAQCINENPNSELIYFDHDYQDDRADRTYPVYKTSWNPRLLLSGNYVGAAIVVRPWAYAQGLAALNARNIEPATATLYQWLLALSPVLKANQVLRIPSILYTLNASTRHAHPIEPTGMYSQASDHAALQQHIAHTKLPANGAQHSELPCLDIQFQKHSTLPAVDIIIPTRDRIDLLSQCVEPLIASTQYSNYTVTIVDNDSQAPETKAYLQTLVEKHKNRVKVLSWPHAFNYSAINNYAASQSLQDVLVLLNNDTEITHANWLFELVSELQIENTGCVGAKLLYPSTRIQHAGIMSGKRMVAGHAYRFFKESHSGYLGRLKMAHNVAAVTAACLAIRRDLFQSVGGLNEEHLAVAFNDVDLCLKVRAKGYDVTWTPKAQLVHHESVSRGLDQTLEKAQRFEAELHYMQSHWGEYLNNDCAWHPVFELQNDVWEIAPWCEVKTP